MCSFWRRRKIVQFLGFMRLCVWQNKKRSDAHLTHTKRLTNIKLFSVDNCISSGTMDLPMDHQTLEWCCRRFKSPFN